MPSKGMMIEKKIIPPEPVNYQYLVENLSYGIILIDPGEKITFANQAAKIILGAEDQNIIGHHFNRFLTTEDYITVKQLLLQLKPKESSEIEIPVIKFSGLKSDIKVNFTQRFDDRGQLAGYSALIQSVSEERDTRMMMERLISAIEQTNDGIAMTDLDPQLIYLNQSFAQMHGYEKEEMICLQMENLYPEDERAGLADRINTVYQKGNWAGVIQHKKKNDTTFPAQVSVTLLRNNKAEPEGILIVARDISEQKKAEEKLIKAKEFAISANKAKSNFLANISHEIRTPLNGVIGMNDLLSETELDSVQREYVEIIKSSSEHLLGLINQVLDYSKFETKQLELESIEFDLHDMIKKTADSYQPAIGEKGLSFSISINPAVDKKCIGDPQRIRQVVTNLLGNAVKFTLEGKIHLRLETVSKEDLSSIIRVEIEDTGIGVAPDMKEKIFEPFMQVDTSSNREFGGTGLGLAICKQLVELMGGEIGVNSQEGKGSLFWFTIPLTRVDPGPEIPAEGETFLLNQLNILVINDTFDDKEFLRDLFIQWRCRFKHVEDALYGIKILQSAVAAKDPFSVVIINKNNTNVDEIAIAENIKQYKAFLNIPIILLTEPEMEVEADQINQAGIHYHVIKPVRKESLKEILLSIVSELNEVREYEQSQIQSAGERRKVLIVEDNIMNQQVIKKMLDRINCDYDVVANGFDALHCLQNNRYCLVFMDLLMPLMDGFEATRAIRDPNAKVLQKDIPIVAMTANALKGDREKCLDAGMNDYIAKPITIKVVDRMINNYCG